MEDLLDQIMEDNMHFVPPWVVVELAADTLLDTWPVQNEFVARVASELQVAVELV